MSDLKKLEELVRNGVDEQAQAYAGNLLKTFMAPNSPKGAELFVQGLRKLAKNYNEALELIDAEFKSDDQS